MNESFLVFVANLERAGGKFLAFEEADALAPIRSQIKRHRLARLNTHAIGDLQPLYAAGVLLDTDDADYTVVRAAFAMAATGSICLTNAVLNVGKPQHVPSDLIVLLDPDDIVPDLMHAYRRPEWRRISYAVFYPAVSSTGHLEGLPIRGAQHVRSLSVVARRRHHMPLKTVDRTAS